MPVSPGRIRAQDGYSYQLTPTDLLWLGRSLQFESGNHAATAWTYAQRMAAFKRWSSLSALLQAHSQPINPIWRRDGSKCRPGGSHHGLDDCAERRLVRRDEAATIPWDRLRPDVRDVVAKFATARLENPVPRAANFAAPEQTTRYMLRNPASAVVLKDGNWYITERQTNAWPMDFVTMEHEGRAAAASAEGRARAESAVSMAPVIALAAVGGALAAGFAGWAIWRYTRPRR
jgi:hypothetical protein